MSESSGQLRAIIERIERVEAEIHELQQDRRDIYAEAKAMGFDAGTIRAQIKRRRMETHDRQEADALLEAYETALASPEFEVELRQVSEDAMDQAVRLIAEQVEGLQDGPLATALRAGLTLILEERADIRDINERIAMHRKHLRAQGLCSARAMDVVRWIERCDKHGRPEMLAREGVYKLYRATAEAGDPETTDSARDAELLAKFAGVVAKPARPKKAGIASSLLDARKFSGGS